VAPDNVPVTAALEPTGGTVILREAPAAAVVAAGGGAWPAEDAEAADAGDAVGEAAGAPPEPAVVVWPFGARTLMSALRVAGSWPPNTGVIIVPRLETTMCTAGCFKSLGSLNQFAIENAPDAGTGALVFGPQNAPSAVTT
jgi:hypothetical protein